jgi:zinc-ribbon domain
MAKFCAQCGSPVEEGGKFCSKCGAKVPDAIPPVQAAAVTPAAPAQPASQAPPPTPSTTPAPAAATAAAGGPKKSSPFVKILLVVVGLFIFVGVASMATCVYIGYRAKQKISAMADQAKKDGFSLETPQGSVGASGSSAKTAEAATKDVPPYPGATPTESGGGLTFGTSGGVSVQEFETPDSVEQVLAYYKDKFGSKINVVEAMGNAEFTYSTRTSATNVTITHDEDSGQTKINYSRMGK